jgi:hypothetical protein
VDEGCLRKEDCHDTHRQNRPSLPRDIREQLNRRLDDGEPGVQLATWLNSLPEVQAVLPDEDQSDTEASAGEVPDAEPAAPTGSDRIRPNQTRSNQATS